MFALILHGCAIGIGGSGVGKMLYGGRVGGLGLVGEGLHGYRINIGCTVGVALPLG